MSNATIQGKILRGPTTKYMATMGTGEYFWRAAELYGERICQIDAYTHKKESFETVRKRSLRVALQLKNMGVKPKDIVMLSCLNNLDHIVPAVAALFLGARVCSTEPLLEVFDVKYLLTQVKPKVIFVIEINIKIIEEAIQSLEYTPQICVIGKSIAYPEMYKMEKIETEEETIFKPAKVDVKETAFIVFSSGTTSLPKGVHMSHLGVMSVACNCNMDEILFSDDPQIQFSTLYWVSGIWTFTYCLINGQPRIVGPNLSATKFLQLVQTYKVRVAFISNQVLYDLVNMDQDIFKNTDVSSLLSLTMGGSFIDPQMILKLRKILPRAWIVQTYAATEIGTTPTNWFGANKNAYETKFSSVGRPNCNTEIKIVDIETREPLPANQKGEISVKSPYKTNGITNKESLQIFDDEGYLKTGDLGYYDEDGYIYIVDRLNDLFKYKGHRIAPNMIETVLLKHRAIKEAVVIGIPHNSDMNHPAACIVLKKNWTATCQEIYNFIKNNMSDLYLLRGGIKFLDEIPKNHNGKVSRNAIRKIFLSCD